MKMINFLYLLLGKFSWSGEREKYLSFQLREINRNLLGLLIFSIKDDLVCVAAHRIFFRKKGAIYRKNEIYRSIFLVSSEELIEAVKYSLKTLKYFFLTGNGPSFVFPYISFTDCIAEAIAYSNMLTLRFLLGKQKKEFLCGEYLFNSAIRYYNLKAIKYLIKGGYKKEDFFECIEDIVKRDQIDFLKYLISLDYKIEKNFCEKYKCSKSSKIYKYIQEQLGNNSWKYLRFWLEKFF